MTLINSSLNINRLRLDLLFMHDAQPSERAETKMRQNDPSHVVADIENVQEKNICGTGGPGNEKLPLAQQS